MQISQENGCNQTAPPCITPFSCNDKCHSNVRAGVAHERAPYMSPNGEAPALWDRTTNYCSTTIITYILEPVQANWMYLYLVC